MILQHFYMTYDKWHHLNGVHCRLCTPKLLAKLSPSRVLWCYFFDFSIDVLLWLLQAFQFVDINPLL